MGNLWRNYFYYTRQDIRGLLVIAAIIAAALTSCIVVRCVHDDSDSKPQDIDIEAYDRLAASLNRHDKAGSERRPRPHHRKRRYTDWRLPVAPPAQFDPNADDSATMVMSGLPPYVARNIVRYRAKGGTFRRADDLTRIYGMDSTLFNSIRPYITIHPTPEAETLHATAVAYHPVEKYPEGTVIDINAADTAMLMKIPGIGRGYSAMILAYRRRLGGFVSPSQVNEIDNLPRGFAKWFKVAPDFSPGKININRASIERLRDHPYLDFYQARAIIEWRRKYGDLRSLQQLSILEEFSDSTLDRIAPYIEF